jgi:hypothetical protein
MAYEPMVKQLVTRVNRPLHLILRRQFNFTASQLLLLSSPGPRAPTHVGRPIIHLVPLLPIPLFGGLGGSQPILKGHDERLGAFARC